MAFLQKGPTEEISKSDAQLFSSLYKWFPTEADYVRLMVANKTRRFLFDCLRDYTVEGEVPVASASTYASEEARYWETKRATLTGMTRELWLHDKLTLTVAEAGVFIGDHRDEFKRRGVEVLEVFSYETSVPQSIYPLLVEIMVHDYQFMLACHKDLVLFNKLKFKIKDLRATSKSKWADYANSIMKSVNQMISPRNSILVIDSEDEITMMNDASFSARMSEHKKIINERFAGLTGIPVSVDAGIQQSNSDQASAGDIKNYNDTLASVRDNIINPLLDELTRHSWYSKPLVRSYIAPQVEPVPQALIPFAQLAAELGKPKPNWPPQLLYKYAEDQLGITDPTRSYEQVTDPATGQTSWQERPAGEI